MRFFTRTELLVTVVGLLCIGILSYFNFSTSLRRARDSQRREDLGRLSDALNSFHQDFGFFPPSSPDGKIIACKGENFDEVVAELKTLKHFDLALYITGLVSCEWGWDGLSEFTDGTSYIRTIPTDPKHAEGIRYLYISNLNRYQLFSYLEGTESEIGYDSGIVGRSLNCGTKICSFGKAYSITPLDKSIEEYENELLQKKK